MERNHFATETDSTYMRQVTSRSSWIVFGIFFIFASVGIFDELTIVCFFRGDRADFFLEKNILYDCRSVERRAWNE